MGFDKIRRLRSLFTRKRFRHRVMRALALSRRGEARRDKLSLKRLNSRLEVEWRAREVHPWDRDLPPMRTAQMFAEQCLDDTSAALELLFSELPEIDVIEVKVMHPNSSVLIMSGSVLRREIPAVKASSSGMRLRQLGVVYRLNNWQFEPLGSA